MPTPMMFILRDDSVLEIFESPSDPPNWIEAIDIENGEYSFCDDQGQSFLGVVVEPVGRFRAGTFELRPEGTPDIGNALALVDRAVSLEPNKYFPDLVTLRRHLAIRSTRAEQ